MDELTSRAAAAQGIPPELIERTAKARAAERGVSVEALLTEWAGGEVATPGSSPAPAPAAEAAPAAAAPAAPEEPSGPQVEVLSPAAEASDDDEAPTEDIVEEEPVEDRRGALAGFPRWLAAAFFIIPSIALLYALLAPDGPDCGTSGQLAIDPVSGVAVNCDGTAYGVEFVNLFSIGEEVYASRCAACHGDSGGGATGPAMTGGAVLASFPGGSCDVHVEWVELGTSAWPDSTYGALNRPVGGIGEMPGFSEDVAGAAGLTPEQITAVVLYERVAFGGQPLPEAEEDCASEDGEDGETTAAAS